MIAHTHDHFAHGWGSGVVLFTATTAGTGLAHEHFTLVSAASFAVELGSLFALDVEVDLLTVSTPFVNQTVFAGRM